MPYLQCGGMAYEMRLSIVGLTTLETRRLQAHLVEIYKFLRGFERTYEVTFFQRRVGNTKGHDWKLYKKTN